MALKRRPPTAINPLDDFRDALKRQRPCTHHGEIALCKSREEARLWWETIDACSPPKRLEHLRWFGQNDLFFLLVYLLNRKHLDTDFHFARCVEVGANPYNHMDLWFREAGKSEVVSFGQNIRDVLNDPDVTIGIFSHSRPMAKSFLRLIKVEFEGNELLKEVFPDILFKDPQKDSPKWALDSNTPVWSVDGWKRHGDLKPGDKIYGRYGQVITVVGNSGPMHNAQCRRVVFDDCELIASSDHLWPVECKRGRAGKWGVEIYETDRLTVGNKTRRMLPTPVVHPPDEDSPLPIDPYVLGLWLGDGTAGTNIISMHNDDEPEVLVQLQRAGYASYIHRKKAEDNFSMYGVRGLKEKLEALGCLRKKDIPVQYLLRSAMDRLALLQGLMDSDGTCKKDGKARAGGMCTFSNTNSDLAHGVFDLATSLGLRPSIYDFEPKPPGKQRVYHVYFVGVETMPPFRLMRKIKNCKPKRHKVGRYLRKIENWPTGVVNCIKVDAVDGIYLAGFSMVPTHNSEDDGITVRRRFGNRKESTIEAWGLIDGQPTSRRFTILHYDDVISRKEINTPEMVDRTTREFENSLALTASDPPKYRYLATYQEINDTTHQLVNRKFGPVRCYPAVDDQGMPVLFSEEKLAWFRERTSPKMFALQYLLDPVRASSDAQIGFSMDWLTYRKPSEMPEVQTLNIYMVVDPAGNGPHAVSKFALWVMGIDARGNWFALDAVHDRINLAQRADIVIEKLAKWKPLKLGYETYGMQSDVEYLRERFREEGIICNLVPLGGTRSNQDDRIEALIPDFRMGKFILPAGGIYHVNSEGRRVNVIEEFVQHEYCLWPYGRQKDLFDAMSRVKDAKLNVTQPRAYGDSAFKVNDPWGSAASQSGSWMSE